eukprot:5150365-Pyramimonas_sp.AAC.1
MPRHAFVLHAAPRMLVVRVQAPGLELVICVAHAMHSGHKAAERAQFWETLDEHMPKWGVQLLLIDVNARLGSTPISQVGQAGFVQEEDPQGERLRQTLEESDMWAVNTLAGQPDDY